MSTRMNVLKPADLVVDVKSQSKTLKASESPERGTGVKVADVVAALAAKLKTEPRVI